jgi:uncharacterized protein
VQVVVLPRGVEQARRYKGLPGVIVPERAVDGRSLLAHADVLVGAGGTMNREAALLGTPTYTMFSGRLAAVDAELIRLGLLHDLRVENEEPVFAKKEARDQTVAEVRAQAILALVMDALDTAV